MKAGEIISLAAEALSPSGDGVGRHDGVEVHVSGLFPGETALVEIDHLSRHHPRARASMHRRQIDHRGRRAAPCEHHGTCSGCPLMALDPAAQHTIKRRVLEDVHGIVVDRIVAGGDPGGIRYRYASKRMVGGEAGAVVLGSYRRGSHDVVDMRGCLVDHPDLVGCLDELEDACNKVGIEPFDEIARRGELRYVWLKTNGRGQVLLTLITAEPVVPVIWELAAMLESPAGVAWGVQSGSGNAIRGATVRPLRGRQSIELEIDGVRVHSGPLGFLQPNVDVAGVAYHDLTRVPAGGQVRGRLAFDLYAGLGVTTALLRRTFASVIPCESFSESARALGVEPLLAEEFLARRLEREPEHVDLVLANPPRGGLGATVCEQLNRLQAARLHLMSCSPSTLAEDLARLTGSDGAYTLVKARAYDTLPQTPHVELVAWLVARGR